MSKAIEELRQKRLLVRRCYRLEEDGLLIEHRSPMSRSRHKVPYTSLECEAWEYRRAPRGWPRGLLIGFGVFTVLLVALDLASGEYWC